jgi:hypothetical protein
MLENLYTPDCIRTVSGIYINVFEPTTEMICIEDIAHSLSLQCRFGGHLPKFYSVAEHSVNCSNHVTNGSKLMALLHDASEAYLMDIPSPIKAHLPEYKNIESNLMKVIADKFGFEWPMNGSVHMVDKRMLQAEWDCVMLGEKEYSFIKCWSPEEAKAKFLECFEQLTNKKS